MATRLSIATDILASEKQYVANLATLQEVYVVPLLDDLNTEKPRLLPKTGQIIIFLNNVEHLRTLNTKILSEMQACLDDWTEDVEFGRIFLVSAPLMRIYDQYAAAHEEVFSVIKNAALSNAQLATLISECESNPRSRGHNIQTLMLAPLLRAGEYLSAVRRLAAVTPLESPDRPQLANAEAALLAAVAHMDDAIRLERSRGAIQRLNNSWDRDFTKLDRELLRAGPMLKVCRRADKEFQFILFSDCLVYGSRGLGSAYTFHRQFDTAQLRVEEVAVSAATPHAFKLINPEKSFVCKLSSAQQKAEWMSSLSAAIAKASEGKEAADLAPVWDQDAATPNCPFCNDKFTVTFRRHHCRRCGSIVCSNCSKKKLPLCRINKGQPESKKLVRVCDRCFITCPRDTAAAVAAQNSYAQAKKKAEEESKQMGPRVPTGTAQAQRRRSQISLPAAAVSAAAATPPRPPPPGPAPPRARVKTATVLFAFEAVEARDLPLTVGATVTVTDREGEWWFGSSNGKEGWYPSNYVKENAPPPPPAGLKPPAPKPQAMLPTPPAAADADTAAADTAAAGGESKGGAATAGAGDGDGDGPKVFPKPVTKRDMVATEIMTTEQTYVNNLKALAAVFVNPLTNNSNCPTPTIGRIVFESTANNSMAVFFSNVAHMVTLNSTLLEFLEVRMLNWSAEQGLGELFLAYAPLFKMYAQYSRAFDYALKLCDTYAQKSEFAEFLETAHQDPRLGGQRLQSFLIMPIQRLPRYVLLLQELLKRTDEGHVDRTLIPRALADIRESADHVNDVIRDRENREAIQEMEVVWGGHKLATPGRTLVKQGPLLKQCRRTNKQFEFLLFNDAIVYGSSAIASGNTGLASVKFHREIDLSECQAVDVPVAQVENAFSVASPNKSFVVIASSAAEKAAWLTAVQGCITAIREASGAEAVDIAPVWMPDSHQTKCSLCSLKFTLYRRRHHCRKCGRVVCDACSKGRMLLKNVSDKPVRVCDQCLDDFASGRFSTNAATPVNPAATAAMAGGAATAAAAGVGGGAAAAAAPAAAAAAAAAEGPSPKPFSCSSCDCGYDTHAELTQHHETAHAAVKQARRGSMLRMDRMNALGQGGLAAAMAAQTAAVAFPYQAEVMFDYAATGDSQVSITAGAEITITEANGEWLLAELPQPDGSVGWVPGNYVRKL